ncbi:MAG TPA: LemA family protein [Candidatus Paceibacterota bacterium]|nr:LemA family protein [Candidatus Paceibacterota bacterium]
METILLVIVILVILIAGYIAVTYNNLVMRRNRTQEAWSDIDVQLKRRYDLIPNLVETVKGYAAHESGTFEKVVQARNAAMAAQGTKEKAQAENVLGNTLKTLFAVAEAYPDLKASQNFIQLQMELRDTEDKIQAARRFYNSNALDLKTKIETFPSNIVANMFGFKPVDFFELENAEEKEAPKINFKD